MNIIVTGGAGFIGSHIVDEVIEKGHRCYIIDNLCRGKRENINNNAIFFEKDIRDKDIDKIFEEANPDIVFHLAAQIDVRRSLEDPFYDLDVNVNGTLNLLNLSLKYKVKKFIFASTGGAIYGSRLNASERVLPRPLSPYGLNKFTSENYIRIYKEWFGLKYTILRYANVYGPRQSPEGEAGVVAIFITKLLRGERPVIYGKGKMLRDYVYVKDLVKATILSMEKGDNEVINIGTGKSISVNELYEKLIKVTGLYKEPIYKPKRKGEVNLSGLNVRKAFDILKWKAETTLEEGLRETFEWFKNQKEKFGNIIP
uniref:NAD-dependent epimerase/dehydratase family protein n=1 Tax=candidate division WOR-3 bacterium TaxID=2052148 RepID=A0A7C4YFF2_UNCW3